MAVRFIMPHVAGAVRPNKTDAYTGTNGESLTVADWYKLAGFGVGQHEARSHSCTYGDECESERVIVREGERAAVATVIVEPANEPAPASVPPVEQTEHAHETQWTHDAWRTADAGDAVGAVVIRDATGAVRDVIASRRRGQSGARRTKRPSRAAGRAGRVSTALEALALVTAGLDRSERPE
jgi:hypothetical protein